MAVNTFTKAGAKATKAEALPKDVFEVDVNNHQLLSLAYNSYLASGRSNNAKTKTRTHVSGGGKKPWKQKGTGRARAGSIRSPIWRGGGIVFGPVGNENYNKRISVTMKRKAVSQALSLAVKEDNVVSVIESFDGLDGKTKSAVELLKKIGAERRVLVVVENKSNEIVRATNNIADVNVVSAKYLNVYDILNADKIVIEKNAIGVIAQWLGGEK